MSYFQITFWTLAFLLDNSTDLDEVLSEINTVFPEGMLKKMVLAIYPIIYTIL